MPFNYVREGGEFHVNTYTANDQLMPAVTGLADGGYVVTWHSWYQDGDLLGVYAQAYNADGTPRGSEFQVNTETVHHQAYPSIAALPDGGYIITWESQEYGEGIHAQIYNANGTPRGSAIDVKVSGSGEYEPAVAVLSGGGFVVTWWNSGDGSFGGIGSQAFNADGTKRGGEVLVNTTTTNSQLYPDIAALGDGGYVITWQSEAQDGSGIGVYAQAYNANGSTRGSEFRVNTYTASDQKDPEIAALSDGGYVIAWQSTGQDGASGGIYAQAYNADGTARGSEFRVNTTTALAQTRPDITALSGGGYLISWESELGDASGYGIYAQVYNANGTASGSEFLVNSYTTNNQLQPSVAALPTGGFVVSWISAGQEGNWGIYAQTYWAIAVPTSGADTINGSSGDNVIDALAGNDIVNGRGGNDTIDGGAGNDTLTGGAGDDSFLFAPGDGSDLITDLSGGDRVLVSEYTGYESIVQQGSDVVLVFAPGDQITFLNSTVAAVEAALSQPSGTPNPDRLLGTNGEDIISGLGGDDYINGRGGEDEIHGGLGNDTIYGDELAGLDWGNNTLYGDDGDDTIYGGYGVDTIYGGNGNDTLYGDGHDTASEGYAEWDEIYGGAGNDTIRGSGYLYGGADNDTIFGDEQSDWIQGESGNDIIHGGAGDDFYLDGGAGDDEIYGDDGDDYIDSYSGNDFIDGGDGSDTLSFALDGGGVVVSLAVTGPQTNGWFGSDTITGIENLEGSEGNDVLTGDNQGDGFLGLGGNRLWGLGGNDILDGGGGYDELTGGAGADIFVHSGSQPGDLLITDFTPGDSIEIVGNAVAPRITQQGSNVVVDLSPTDESSFVIFTDTITILNSTVAAVQAGLHVLTEGADQVTGTSANDYLRGLGGNDVINGLAGNDTIDGGSGADTMNGGAGDDSYVVDNAGDVVIESSSSGGTDSVNSAVTFSLVGQYIENLVLTGAAAINGTGNGLANSLTGNGSANLLNGAGGNDIVSGMGGNDTLIGGDGNDTLDGGTGADSMDGGGGNDSYVVDNAGDVVIEGSPSGGVDTVSSSVAFDLGGRYVENLVLTGTSAINGTGNGLANAITGNSAANTLTGLGGNDVLDGGGGADMLIGGSGNDSYVVDNAGDVAVETGPSAGIDSVASSISFNLGGQYLDNLTLTGASAINATGNSLANTLTGNDSVNTLSGLGADDILSGMGGNDSLNGGDGNDSLDGGAGADSMTGGGGNDVYVVDNAGDSVIEASLSGGIDSVRSSVSFSLAGRYVEDLVLTGTNAIAGTGNGLDNHITGNSAANTLTGGGGADSFIFTGAPGNDTIADFVSGTDTIDLSAYGITIAQVSASSAGGNTTLAIDSDHSGSSDFTITLIGAGAPQAGDYVF